MGSSIPSWPTQPGPVYVNRIVRHSKFEPLVDEANVLQVNPHYAHIRYPDGRETTVSTRNLAPRAQAVEVPSEPLLSEEPSVLLPVHEPTNSTGEISTKTLLRLSSTA